jgi:hypothetical protein
MEDSAANSNTNFLPQDMKFHSNHILGTRNGLSNGKAIYDSGKQGIQATNGPKKSLAINNHKIAK